MEQGKTYWRKRFREVGIGPDRIMNEIWRAHYVDQLLFSNPVNKAYGVDETVIWEAMRQTQERLGNYDGDAEAYIRVYSTAMAAPAHRFAPQKQWTRAAAIHVWWRTWGEGRTALIWNADRVLAELREASEIFGVGRVYGLADGEDTAHRWQAVYPEIRWVTRDELSELRFGYVHVVGDDVQALEDAMTARRYLTDDGIVSGMVSWETFGTASRREDTLYLTERMAGAWPRVWHVYGSTPGIGAASYRGGRWQIDRKSAAAARYLQPTDEIRIGDLANTVPSEPVTDASLVWVDDAQIANEYATPATGQSAARGRRLQAGDILVAAHGDSYRVALVPADYPAAATVFPVLRPRDDRSGRRLFGSLLQEATRRRLAEVARTEKTALEDCMWESLPLAEPLPTDEQLQRLEEALRTLARTRAAWQTAVDGK